MDCMDFIVGASGRAGLLQENLRQLSEPTMAEAQRKPGIKKSQEQLFSLVKQALDGKIVSIRKNLYRNLVAELVETYKHPRLVDHFAVMLIHNHDLTNRLVAGFDNSNKELDYRQFLTQMAIEFKSENLTEHLETFDNVISCENLLAAVVFLFDWLCSQKGQKIANVANQLPTNLHHELETVLAAFKNTRVYTKAAQFNHSCFSDHLATSSNLALLHSILEIHRIISERRQRALWVQQVDNCILTSEILMDPPDLGKLKVGQLWYHDYYLWPLRNIANQIAELKKCRNQQLSANA